ncbi:MAG: diguanylate cyclase [Rhizobiales bacterium]|nr:diguanylate cyclase [Hyphomicrobiales bacterium]
MARQTFALYRFFARLLDSLDIALCLFDDGPNTVLWNETFLSFFPEHDGHVYSGEPYSENLRRFYEARLDPDEKRHIERYIEEGIDRHRNQSRPFFFTHRGRVLRVASLPTPSGGRLRLWIDAGQGRDGAGVAGTPSETHLPIDLLEHIADGATILDLDDRIVAANKEFRQLYGVTGQVSVIGSTFADVVRQAWVAEPEASRPQREIAMLDNMRFAGAPFEIELPHAQWRRVIAHRTAGGIGYFTHADITQLKRQQEELRQAERRAREDEYRFRLLAENASDVIITALADQTMSFVSPAATRILGWDPREMVGRRFTEVLHPDEHEIFQRAGRATDWQSEHTTFTCRVRGHGDGDRQSWTWMEISIGIVPAPPDADHAIAFVYTLRDATRRIMAEQALRQANEDLRAIASTDGLTGVSNRRHFDGVFREELRRAGESGTPLSLLLIDIDNFKAVNDVLGHLAGDDCLRILAHIIKDAIDGSANLVARYGGEEFAVLLPGAAQDEARQFANALRARIKAEPWNRLHPDLLGVTVSIGLCTVDDAAGLEANAVFDAADKALYRAKKNGRDCIAT